MRPRELDELGAPLRKVTTLAALVELAPPLDIIPGPAVRRSLRQAVGVGPHVCAAVLAVGAETFDRWERADVSGNPGDIRTFGGRDDYARLLNVIRAWLQAHRPDLLASITNGETNHAQ